MATSVELLKEIPLFVSMDDDERAALAAIMGAAVFTAGQVIYRAGDPGGSMHVVATGQVEISIEDDDGKKLILDTLSPGEYFGELSLIDGGLRSATVTALEPTSTLALEREALRDLLMQKPHMAQDMMHSLAKIIRRTDGLLRSRVTMNANEVFEEHETLGARVADGVAKFGGSWFFIFSFGGVLVAWVLVNTIILAKKPFDEYPFILLNLFLSMLAAIQAPVIMMSQNRQDKKDRIRSELDYQVNLKAELGVSEILRRVTTMEEELKALRAQTARD